MNEDRHNSNVGFLMSDNGELKLSPIYDNGYSLLYDDIKGMLNDFKSEYRYCLCNAPLYEERFNAAERIFQKCLKYMCLQLILILKEIKLQIGLWR